MGIMVLAGTVPGNSAALTADEIMQKTNWVRKPATSRILYTVYAKRNGKSIRMEMVCLSKSGPEGQKTLMDFTNPAGMKLLSFVFTGRGVDQWVRRPSGQVKRITNLNKHELLFCGNLNFEDLEPRDISFYSYQFLGDSRAADADCYKIKTIRKIGPTVYDHQILHVRKSDYFIVRIEYHKNGLMQKYQEYQGIKTIDGFMTAHRVVVATMDKMETTELNAEYVKYNMPLKDDLFLERHLK